VTYRGLQWAGHLIRKDDRQEIQQLLQNFGGEPSSKTSTWQTEKEMENNRKLDFRKTDLRLGVGIGS
jgi:ribosomal 50S subunit-associated protein YjgA (DUF615 family)